ncbi:MAG: hypothetical protein KJ915_06635 [Candidatus Omnitrophica bacterium]|nr:hypothetical protein [Candidatus Omnitrophota bacterium]
MNNKFKNSKIFVGSIVCIALCLQAVPSFAGLVADKIVLLGLDTAGAMAKEKDMKKGAEEALKKTTFDWLWDIIGGVEKIAFVAQEAEIPAMKDKINLVVSTIQNIDKISTQLGSGKYDEALFTATDQAVGMINHPLVTVMWEAIKMTYESQKLLADAKAQAEIEALYGIVSGDRRIAGEYNPDQKGPAQFKMNAETVDYFFNDYLITSAGTRQLVRSYVEKELGQEWPEQSWTDYLKSYTAIGSGVDLAQAAEIEALSGELRNVARGWISKLLADVNKMAQVQYDQTRVRQQMGEFHAFAEQVSHFYNNDYERMMSEFMDLRRMKQSIPEYRALEVKSKARYTALSAEIAKLEKLNVLKSASAIEQECNTWQLQLLTAASGAETVGEKALGQSLYAQRRAWLEFRDKFMKDLKEDMEGSLDEASVFPVPTVNSNNPEADLQRYGLEKGMAMANVFYSEVFKPMIIPYEFPEDIESFSGEIEKFCQMGNFVEAKKVLDKLDIIKKDLEQYYTVQMKTKIANALANPPSIVKEAMEKTGISSVGPDAQTTSRMKVDQIFRYRNGWTWAVQRAYDMQPPLYQADAALLAARKVQLQGIIATFTALANQAGGKYRKYASDISAALTNLPIGDADDFSVYKGNWGMYREFKQIDQAIEEYTYLVPKKNVQGNIVDIPGALRYWAQEIENNSRHPQYIIPGYRESFSMTKQNWENARQAWEQAPRITVEEEEIIRALYFQNLIFSIPSNQAYLEKQMEGFNPMQDQAFCDKAVNNIGSYLSTMKDTLSKLEQKLIRNFNNQDQDATFLKNNAKYAQDMIEALIAAKLVKHINGNYGELIPNLDIAENDMAKAKEPYLHYMTVSELNTMKAGISRIINSSKANVFIRKYLPNYAQKLDELSSLANVKPASGENIIIRGADAVYEKDIVQAEKLIKSLRYKSEDNKFNAILDQIMPLIPLMLVKNVKENWYGVKFPDDAETNSVYSTKLGKRYLDLYSPLQEVIDLHHQWIEAESYKQFTTDTSDETVTDTNKMPGSQNDFAANAMYSLYGLRINTQDYSNVSGDVLFTQDDLDDGKIKITANIPTLDNIETMLLSLDDGRSWDEMPKASNIAFEFIPQQGVRYEPIIKLKRTGAYSDVELPLLRNGVLSYEDVSYNEQVLATLQALSNAYEKQDVAEFAKYISRDYLGNQTFLEEGIRFDFDMFIDIQLTIFVNRIESRKGMWIAETKWDKKQTPRTTGQQQLTSGQTTMIFVAEDGVLKIKNLRGNLLFATLSPEIAEASGLNQATVDAIRTAHDDRNPTQPGAGEIEDDGGVSSGTTTSALLTVQTATLTIIAGSPSGFNVVSGTTGQQSSGDFFIEFAAMFFANSGAVLQDVTNSYSFDNLSTAPDVVDSGGVGAFMNVPRVILFKTVDDYYGKMKVTVADDNGDGTSTVSFQYAVQTDSTRNIATQ